MDARNELIHRLLDGGLAREEEIRLREEIAADPTLAAELRRMEDLILLLERSKTMSPGPGFTASIMRRLPDLHRTLGDRTRSFLFGERVLRWNMASAAMLAMLLVIAVVAIRFLGVPETAPEHSRSLVMVTFRIYAPQASNVALAGEFNRWQPGVTLLAREDKGFWSVQVPLEPGSYTYMFVLDGDRWVTDPEAGQYRDDGYGHRNAVLRVDHL